jgi:SpoIID/LytB domain protein
MGAPLSEIQPQRRQEGDPAADMTSASLLAILWLAFSSTLSSPGDLSPVARLGDTVRVGLISSLGYLESLTFTCDSDYALMDPRSGQLHRISRAGAACTLQARDLKKPDHGVSYQVRIKPLSEGACVVIKDPPARYARFRGAIEVGITDSGKLLCVNEIPMEDYLRGVVPAEVPSSFAPEAIKAQAVAARTYAERGRGRHAALGFDLCDSTDCQVYSGGDRETERTDSSVAATRGAILTNGGKPICAMYHSDSGGGTESAAALGKGDELPYLASVDDAKYCTVKPKSDWSAKLSGRQLGQKLASRAGSRIGDVRSIQVVATNDSGRVSELQIEGESGSCRLSGAKFRELCGPTVIKSALFTVTHKGSGFEFTGRGYGHGLGLCQWGAQGMASAPYSKTAEEILKYYYAGVEITQLDSPGGEIVGKLTDAATNAAIARARVEALGYGGWSAYSDSEGKFSLAGLPAGKVDLRISKPGYKPLSIWALEVKRGATASVAKTLDRD